MVSRSLAYVNNFSLISKHLTNTFVLKTINSKTFPPEIWISSKVSLSIIMTIQTNSRGILIIVLSEAATLVGGSDPKKTRFVPFCHVSGLSTSYSSSPTKWESSLLMEKQKRYWILLVTWQMWIHIAHGQMFYHFLTACCGGIFFFGYHIITYILRKIPFKTLFLESRLQLHIIRVVKGQGYCE